MPTLLIVMGLLCGAALASEFPHACFYCNQMTVQTDPWCQKLAMAGGAQPGTFGDMYACDQANDTSYWLYHIEGRVGCNLTWVNPAQCNGGLCLPASCTSDQVLSIVQGAMQKSGHVYNATVRNGRYEMPSLWRTGPLAMGVFVGLLGVFVVLATWNSYIFATIPKNRQLLEPLQQKEEGAGDDEKEKRLQSVWTRILGCFDGKRNLKELFKRSESPDAIFFLDGLRSLAMIYIILGHSIYLTCLLGMDNVDYMVGDLFQRWSFQFILNATFSVDCFFFLSGFLLGYILYKRILTKQRIVWYQVLIHRVLRLCPIYFFVIGVAVFFGPYMSDEGGPFFYRFIDAVVTPCQRHWWGNLLFINNIYPDNLNDGCIGWSWYLAVDMQLFLVGVFLMWILKQEKKIFGMNLGDLAIVAAIIAVCCSNWGLSWIHRFSADRLKITPLYTRMIYTKPWARGHVYLIALYTGVLVRRHLSRTDPDLTCEKAKKYFRNMPNSVALLISSFGIFLCFAVLFFTHHSGGWSRWLNATYLTFSKVIWAIGLLILTVMSFVGRGGVASDLLSSRMWTAPAKLTFGAYLVHPIIITAISSNRMSLYHYSDIWYATMFMAVTMLAYLVAGVLWVFVECPAFQLVKVMTGR